MPTCPQPAPRAGDDHTRRRRRLMRRLAAHTLNRLRARPGPPAAQITTEGLTRLRRTLSRHRQGANIDDVTIIRLALDLHIVRIRDEAWLAVQDDPAALTALLLDLCARTDAAFTAPAGALLGLAAWYQGEHEMAGRAVAGVLRLNPDYRLAHLLELSLRHRLPAEKLRAHLPGPAELDFLAGPARPEWLHPLQSVLLGYLAAGQAGGPAGDDDAPLLGREVS